MTRFLRLNLLFSLLSAHAHSPGLCFVEVKQGSWRPQWPGNVWPITFHLNQVNPMCLEINRCLWLVRMRAVFIICSNGSVQNISRSMQKTQTQVSLAEKTRQKNTKKHSLIFSPFPRKYLRIFKLIQKCTRHRNVYTFCMWTYAHWHRYKTLNTMVKKKKLCTKEKKQNKQSSHERIKTAP